MARWWMAGVVAVGLALFSLRATHGEIMISEIMYNPAGADSGTRFNREWVELFNRGDMAVDLGGWQLGDSQDNDWASPIPASTLLEPGQALVITGDALGLRAQWGSSVPNVLVQNFPTLDNNPSATNETIALRNDLGEIVDAVNYDDAFGWPKANGSNGHSIYVLPSALSTTGNDIGSNWRPSTWGAYGARYSNVLGEDQASPGFVESVSQITFAPSDDAVWSMAIIPDSQNYSKSTADRGTFTQMTEWIRDNRDAFNIQVVLHEGDIVNNNNTNNPTSGNQTGTQQWQNAQASMHVLNGHVPYIVVGGNHDYGTTNAQNRDTQLNTFFKATDNPLVDPTQGGILKGTYGRGRLDNAYYEFTAPDGRKMLVIALEWEPQSATVEWANGVASRPEYADHTAILLTHAYLRGDNSRYPASRVDADYSGQELWQGLVRHHENFEMAFNGHFGGDGSGYLASSGDEGNTVHQMFFNTQFEAAGGNGWLRVVEFLEDGKTARVRTYSPLLDLYRDGPEWEFEFEISPLHALAPTLGGDFNLDGIVDAADYTLWRDTFGSTELLGADGNDDGIVNEVDYTIWKQNFGATLAADAQTTVAVPEPGAMLLALLASLATFPRLRCRRS